MTGHWAAGGIEIHYARTGGAGPPLILLHGLTGSGRCWTPVARALEDEYDVLMPDARGHGQSSAPAEGYEYDALAGDVLGMIAALGLVRPVLLGHSMGGMTAALAAACAGSAVRGLVLADPTFLEPPRQLEVYQGDAAEQHRRDLSRDRHELLAEARARHPRRSAELLDWLVTARLQTRPAAWDILRPPNPDFRALVSRLEIPVLLVLADHGVVPLQTAQALQHLNPRLQIATIQEAGHGLHYDQPTAFERAVRAFLLSLPGD